MSTNRQDIDLGEWMAALAELRTARPDGLMTASEASRGWGVGVETARERIRVLMGAGRAEYAGHYPVQGIDGRMRPSPYYRLKAKTKRKGA